MTYQPDSITPTMSAPRRQVLLVDDSRAQRRILAIQLQRAGYDVSEAENAEEALDMCQNEMPDIVISDWVQPGMDGLEFCRQFRDLAHDRYSYFFLLSSRGEKENITEGLRAGADDFLTKPVSGSELLARLAAGERILTMQEHLRNANAQLNQTLNQLRETQAELDSDLREAQLLQQDLVRDTNAVFGKVQLSLLMRPAGHVGGDLVGFFPISDRRMALFALDVSGHGVAAALLCARLAALLSGGKEHGVALRVDKQGRASVRSPQEVVQQLNTLMLEELRTDRYFTIVYADLDFESGHLKMVQAGHPHPVLQRADGSIERIGDGGMPVGMFAQAEFEQIELTLSPGDRVLIASDGINEAEDATGHQFGDCGVDRILCGSRGTSNALLEELCTSALDFGSGQPADDVSAVLIEFNAIAAE